MFHLLPNPPAPDVEPAPPAVSSTPFKAAAAASVPPEVTHHHWPVPAFITAIGHIHLRLPEPRPSYPPHEASYFEAGEMSRLMEHL
jgi:hypothetical protein